MLQTHHHVGVCHHFYNFCKVKLIKREKFNNNSNKYEINEYLSTFRIKNPKMSSMFAKLQTCCTINPHLSQT